MDGASKFSSSLIYLFLDKWLVCNISTALLKVIIILNNPDKSWINLYDKVPEYLIDFEKFYIKDKLSIGRYNAPSSSFSVAVVWRDGQFGSLTKLHLKKKENASRAIPL